jgi:hypothetical protein
MSEVKRWIKTQIPSYSYNAPEYVLASDFDRLRAENARLREALTAIASFDEVTAKKAFATYGSIALFDESNGVRIARRALAAQEKSDE